MIFTADLIACSTCFGHHYAHQQGYVSGLRAATAAAAAARKTDT